MIKINLLKAFAKQVSSDNASTVGGDIKFVDEKTLAIGFAKKLTIMCLGALGLYFYEQYNLPLMNEKLNSIQQQITEVSTFNQKSVALKKEIEKYEKDLKQLNTQMDFLELIQSEKTLPIQLISKIKDAMNAKVWLNSIASTQRGIEIRGTAESPKDVSDFSNALSNTSYLKDVIIASTDRKKDLLNKGFDLTLQDFTIRASFAEMKKATLTEGAN